MTAPHEGAPRWMAIAAIALFAVYAANFLYYFVDDEAIPYVYAQNILHGKGIAYNAIEGRVEGYSDFLHVWAAVVILAIRNLLGLPKLSVFFVGKALSLACGAGIVLLAWDMMRRLRVPRAGTAAGLATLALAGPLAVWSCSSLETVPFAFVFTVLIRALMLEADTTAAVAAALLVLLRIDGVVHASILIGAFAWVAPAPRRREILRSVALPAGGVLFVYHAWRVAYFGALLPAPVEAKVLYKLRPHAGLLVKAPERSYVGGFAGLYGWWIPVALGAAALRSVLAGGAARALSIATVPLIAYVALVGDWMFGFRFFVVLLPVFSLIVALSLGAASNRWPHAAAALSLSWIVAVGAGAPGFTRTYTQALSLPSFLHAPSRDLRLFFRPYYGFYETVRPVIPGGAVTAYNQAGLLPFLLDLNNIDDLGLCSSFYASLPSTDVYFTEGGRQAPLTNKPRLRAHQAYLAYRNVQFIMSGTDVLRRANGNDIPPGLFGNLFGLAVTDAGRDFAVYRRTGESADRFTRDEESFVENLAHVSYVRRASMDGAAIGRGEYARRLPFLHDGTADLRFTGGISFDVQFADADEHVQAISIYEVRATERSVLSVTLLAAGGRIVHRFTVPLLPGAARGVAVEMPAATSASRLVVEVSAGHGIAAAARISDLRVEGQTPALRDYIARHLRFAGSEPPTRQAP